MTVEFQLQAVLFAVPAVAFLALAGWCLSQTASGRWAGLGAGGAGLLGLSIGVPAVANLETAFLQTIRISEQFFTLDHVGTALGALQAAGALMLVAAFIDSRHAAPRSSLYGPPAD